VSKKEVTRPELGQRPWTWGQTMREVRKEQYWLLGMKGEHGRP
jgi:hypothetical protein